MIFCFMKQQLLCILIFIEIMIVNGNIISQTVSKAGVIRTIQIVSDSSLSSYELLLDDFREGCVITKMQQTKVIWIKSYDNYKQCKGARILLTKNNQLFAVFIVQPLSFLHNKTENAISAFKHGLYPTTSLVTLDAIVRIDTDTGELSSGTFLFSKFCEPFIDHCDSRRLKVIESSFIYNDEKSCLKFEAKSEAYPPSDEIEQDTFNYLLNDDEVAYSDCKVNYCLDTSLSRFIEASYQQKSNRILINRK